MSAQDGGRQVLRVSDGTQFLNGDSRDISAMFDSDSVDFVVTSPPYWAIRDYGYDNQIGYSQTYEEYLDDLKTVFEGCYDIMKNERWIAINVGTVVSQEGMKFLSGDVVRICTEIGFVFRKDIIWNKPRGQTKWQRGGTQFTTNPFPRHFNTNINHEFILLFSKGEVPRRGREEAERLTAADFGPYIDYERPYLRKVAYSVWDITPVNSPRLDEKHAAPFPEEIPRRLIELFTYPGEVVLDPFAGAGTSLRIAKELGRVPAGVEMSKEYHAGATKRLTQVANPKKTTILQSTAARFSASPNQRLEEFNNSITKIEKKIRDLCKEEHPPTLSEQIKQVEKRLKRLNRRLVSLKTSTNEPPKNSILSWDSSNSKVSHLSEMSVKELKSRLKSKGLKTTGRKSVLIERLEKGD